jgi:type IV pilus assembly protein PilA
MFSSAIQRLNDRRNAAGDAGADAGFTLIELMVVLLILAILLAIAIPTFLGVTKSANDRAAQSNLNTALVNAKAAYQSQGQSYTSPSVLTSALFAAALGTAEPSLAFTTGNSAGQNSVSVQVSTTDGNGIVLAGFSKSNNCWYIIDNPTAVSTTLNPPWTGTVVGTNGGTAVPGTGQAIVVPGTLGTIYAEVKGDIAKGDCSAARPVIGTGASYQWSTTGFPSL